MKKGKWMAWLYVFGWVIAIVICLAVSYAIAVSDLPPWFKFFLLKGK